MNVFIFTDEQCSKPHRTLATKQDLDEMEKRIMATQTQLIADLQAILTQQKKTAAEIGLLQASMNTLTQTIAELQALIDAGEVSDELEQAVAAVKQQAQVVDDLIPDVPPTA